MRDCGDCICGILAYRVEQDLRSGRVFSIQLFVAADILNSLSMTRALLDAAEIAASRLGCAAVQVRVSSDQGVVGAHLQRLGLLKNAYISCRKSSPTQAS
jgi:hypothetical protein